jgi:anti-sigma factor RsiW
MSVSARADFGVEESVTEVDCAMVEGQLDGWIAGRLPAERREPLERHLATCLECRLDAEVARVVRSVLGRVPRKELLRALREDQPAGER